MIMIIILISECHKLAQKKYKTRHKWVGKVIHMELCKRLKLTILPKGLCTSQNPSQRIRYIKILWYLGIQIDHLITSRRPDLVITNKKKKKKKKKRKERKRKKKRTYSRVDFPIQADQQRIKVKR